MDIVSPHNTTNVDTVVFYSSDDNSTVTYLYGSDEDTITASVVCSESARFSFEHIYRIRISGVRLIRCANNVIMFVNYFYLESCRFEGQGHNGTGISLNAVNVVYIVQSTFSSYNGIEMPDPYYNHSCRAGGAIAVTNSTYSDHDHITVDNCTFFNNTISSTQYGYGGAIHVVLCNLNVYDSLFFENTVNAENEGKGGAISAISSSVYLVDSVFDGNTVNAKIRGNGGALFAEWSDVTMRVNIFSTNAVVNAQEIGNGGAVNVKSSYIIMYHNTFSRNTINSLGDSTLGDGGAMYAEACPITMHNSEFLSNTVTVSNDAYGGALDMHFCYHVSLTNTTFIGNSVLAGKAYGGAIYSYAGSTLSINGSTIVGNTVTGVIFAFGAGIYLDTVDQYAKVMRLIFRDNDVFVNGESKYRASGVLCTMKTNLTSFIFLNFQSNNGKSGVVYAEQSTLLFSGNTTITNNNGSIYAFNSNVTFTGHTDIMYNSLSNFDLLANGAVTGFQSQYYFYGAINIFRNMAIRGGGLFLTESKVFSYGNVTIAYSYASVSGGGVYAYQSEIYVLGNTLAISDNVAVKKGGGLHAISSTVKLLEGSILLSNNYATKGGGICLELNSKLYIIKSKPECQVQCTNYNNQTWLRLELTNNTADFGGALFITDETNSGTCAAQTIATTGTTATQDDFTDSECFLQTLIAYNINFVVYELWNYLNFVNYYFNGNSAKVAGSTLYGGLLDRCNVSPFSKVFRVPNNDSGNQYNSTQTLSYMLDITDINLQDFNSSEVISSGPVRVCFCRHNQLDCSYKPETRYVNKGELFVVSLVAVDQVNNTIPNVTIHGSVSLEGRLGTGQSIQNTSLDGSCTNLEYNIYSTREVVRLKLYAEGPCVDIGISETSVSVIISPCPIGFKDVNQVCICDPYLYPEYISSCSINTNSVQRKQNVWISFVNDTKHQGYITHKHCPFDYCLPSTETVSINLGDHNGSDELCTFNRSGMLCGSCKDGLSLSLGSSRCTVCSNSWLGLLIAFVVVGIALVVFILVCNLTVAIGTINGLIFYANIIAANRAVFLPFVTPNIVTVFIAWLNLDFGFETCFFDGMNSYAKVWLQIVFPLYILLLVAMVIYLSEHSHRFARLLLDKNPVATLSTLILLSYTKFIRTIIAALSITTLEYSDGSREIVWLYDSNIRYFEWKHILLLITALLILFLGLVYTLLLLFWQWLYSHSNRKMLKWVSNPRLFYFMDAYQAPYDPRHRYWTGLLLLSRVILYLISALNVIGDPNINLIAIICVVVGLQFHSKVAKTVYKQWPLDVLESSYILNLTIFATGSLYLRQSNGNQVALAYCSTSIAIATFTATVIYHACTYVLKNILLKLKRLSSSAIPHKHHDHATGKSVTTTSTQKKNVHVDYIVESGSVSEFDGNPSILDTEREEEDDLGSNQDIVMLMSRTACDSREPWTIGSNFTDCNTNDHYVGSTSGIEDSKLLVTCDSTEGTNKPATATQIELKKIPANSLTQLTELIPIYDDAESLADESLPLL